MAANRGSVKTSTPKPPSTTSIFATKRSDFSSPGNRSSSRATTVQLDQSRSFLPEEFEGADVELYSVRFSSKNKGWVVGSVSKRERVVDSIWSTQTTPGRAGAPARAGRLELIHIDFVSDKRGWIVGADGTVLFTRDAGESWTKQNTGTNATLYHVDFRGDKRGWAVGDAERFCAPPTAAKRGRRYRRT